jgi:hypothetical protein
MHEGDGQTLSLISLTPTVWPAKDLLRLIFFRSIQSLPQRVIVMALSWKGYSSSPIPV